MKISHVHVDDVGRAALVVATNDDAIGNAYNIAAPEPLSGADSIRALGEPLGLEVSPIIPYSATLMKIVNFLINLLPAGSGNFLDKRLLKNWNELREKHGLTDDLVPRLDRDWIGYTTGNSVYDVTKLKELGMVWKWPDTTEGMKATVKWYQDNEWLP